MFEDGSIIGYLVVVVWNYKDVNLDCEIVEGVEIFENLDLIVVGVMGWLIW